MILITVLFFPKRQTFPLLKSLLTDHVQVAFLFLDFKWGLWKYPELYMHNYTFQNIRPKINAHEASLLHILVTIFNSTIVIIVNLCFIFSETYIHFASPMPLLFHSNSFLRTVFLSLIDIYIEKHSDKFSISQPPRFIQEGLSLFIIILILVVIVFFINAVMIRYCFRFQTRL